MIWQDMSVPMDAAALVRSHQAGVWRYLRFLGCDPSEADDLTQETFLAVFEKPFAAADPASTQAYLKTVSRNLFLKSKRRDRVVPPDPGPAWSRFEGDDGGNAYLDALRSCLDGLDGREARALGMRYRDRASHAAMAASLGLGEEGVKTLLRRAKEGLRRCVEGKLRND